MKILLWGRQTGKTRECAKILRNNKDVCCITFSQSVRQIYPIDVRDRIYSYRSLPKGYMRCIIDEVDVMPRKELIKILNTFDVLLITGTPIVKDGKSENFEWLCMKYPNEVNIKKTKTTKKFRDAYVEKDRYLSEFECVW